jgi:uncharacterized protein
MVAGLFGGVVSGVAGLGAGIAALPVLLYGPELFGLDPLSIKEITGLTVVQSLTSGIVNLARHHGAGYVHRPLVMRIGIPAGVAALTGALVSRLLPDVALLAMMAAMTLTASVVMIFPGVLGVRKRSAPEADWKATKAGSPPYDKRWATVMGALVGGAGGISGLPGAFLLVPLIIYRLGIPTRIAIGSNLGIMMFASGAALAGKVGGSLVPLYPALVITASAMTAALVGYEINRRLSPRHLRGILALLVAATAVRVLVDVFV